VNADKDTGNISKDGLTGLKSKAYFLISLGNSIDQLALPNASPNTGLVTIYIGNAVEADLVSIATMVDKQADHATHYKNGKEDVIAGLYGESESQLVKAKESLQLRIAERFPNLRFGVVAKALAKDTDAEQALDEVARNAYDAMLQKPAV
jgi:hypothetical protein